MSFYFLKWQLTSYFNCHSFIEESIRPLTNVLWIYPWVNPLPVVLPRHPADFESALFDTSKSGHTGSFSPKYANDRLTVPVVINQRVSMFDILVPNHTIRIGRRVLVVVKTTRDGDTGTQHCFNITRHINCPSPGTTGTASCKRNHFFLYFVFACCLRAISIQSFST